MGEFNVLDAIFKGTMTALCTIGDVSQTEKRLPKYWKAINDELLLAEQGYFRNDKESVELHCKRAISYQKKATKILKEIG